MASSPALLTPNALGLGFGMVRDAQPAARHGGGSASALVIRPETTVDFAQTAALAAEGFGAPPGVFKPAKMRWLYERAFSHGTTVLSLYAGDRKVGQVALVQQRVNLGDKVETAIALVDLFILEPFRSRDIMARLYGEVERLCQDNATRFILAVPNQKGAKVNVRYLRLAPFMKLDIRVGLSPPWASRRAGLSVYLADLGEKDAVALFSRYLPAQGTGLHWTPETFWNRFRPSEARYGVHATDRLLLVSAANKSRGLDHTLLCAFLAVPGAIVTSRDTSTLTHEACAFHGRPLFVYAGRNDRVPLPGVSVPERLRPSAMVVQIRDFRPGTKAVEFSRFELLDFDFA